MGVARDDLPVADAPPACRLVPIHPESVAGDPATLRWSIPAAALGMVGVPAVVPTALQALLDDAVLESLFVEPAAVSTTLGPGASWREHGARVRTTLQEALLTPEQWRPAGAGSTADELLRAAVLQVLDGEVGHYIRSHGGSVRLLDVHDRDVKVELAGACSHCPASEITLTNRIETGIRALYPALGRVSSRSQAAPNLAHRVLNWFPARAE